ncbi:hypothetical protein EI94DRAFT_1793880 [Lactarius quietus]|nr:hypothetical protein EI94DRAFT_1793880 [Lactarius quietus]
MYFHAVGTVSVSTLTALNNNTATISRAATTPSPPPILPRNGAVTAAEFFHNLRSTLRIRPVTPQDAVNIPARFQRTVIHATSSTSVSIDVTTSAPAAPGATTATAPPSPSPVANAKRQQFTFDQVHGQDTTQHALFTATTQPLIARFLEGFNCTILAYDPTNGIGIIPRAVSAIFQRARAIKEERGSAWSCSIKGSFIEIYNEDLIDLLVDDGSGARREVQIREGKDGSIIWGGLREVQVKNAAEVMNLIRQGTSIRRTNETDMNAQSSRSHAIFSLTLVQRRYAGSGAPPRSSSPLPLNGRSPSRLARPGSMLAGPAGNRVSSPTFGRPGTPGAMGRTSMFRPANLAGSERLKRTAAAGDRIKEGISINSGLLALGNVILLSLTRLLQDSLGGNAHTLMIACVSPVEWNAAETVNTLKYANRARNIKNRATINEKEEGWDDVEWLQGMVTRLRKELKVIKEGGTLNGYPPEPEAGQAAPVESVASKRMLANYNDMKNNYEELREKYVARNEELTRLRKEHGEWHRASSSSGIRKTISAMEAELSLNRAALRLTNDLVEEKEEELNQITERKVAAELYIEELRARLAKLTEREASTEAYVHDLEEKMRQYDESNISSSESMSDLKRELIRFKEAELHSAKYITDLEVRLAKSDESLLALRGQVEKLELECERRQDEARVLQERLEGLKKDGQSWRTDLEERERKVLELEAKMEEWQAKKKEAGEAWERLGNVASEVQQERNRLEAKVATSGSNSASGTSTPKEPELALENQLVSLQQAHTATLADLSSVTAKYRDALCEISDLAAQIQEAKLNNASLTDSSEREAPFFSPGGLDGVPPFEVALPVGFAIAGVISARSRKASFSSHGTSSPAQSPHRPNLSISLPALNVAPNERSAASLEKEIMRLQDVLKEREQEIAHLEISLKEKEAITPRHQICEKRLIKTVLQNGSDAADVTANSESDESLDRLNELMRAMAQKESQHREATEALNEELNQLRRQHDELTVLSNNQSSNKHEDSLAQLEEVEQRKAELEKSIEQAKVDHALAVEQLRQDHEQLLRAKDNEVNELTARLKEEHSSDLTSLHEQLREASSALEKSHKDHAEAFGRLQAEHEDELRRCLSEAAIALAAAPRHDEILKQKDDEMAKTEEEYYNGLVKLRTQHDTALEHQATQAKIMLERLREDHTAELRVAELAREGSLSESQSVQVNAIKDIQNEHAATLAKKEAAFADDLEKLESTHAAALQGSSRFEASLLAFKEQQTAILQEVELGHQREMATLKASHQIAVDSLTSQAEQERASLQQLHDKERAELLDAREKALMELTANLETQHGRAMADTLAKAEQERSIYDLREKLENDLQEALTKAHNEHAALIQDHGKDLAAIRMEHDRTLADLNTALKTEEENHRKGLDLAKLQTDKLVADAKEDLEKTTKELETKHQQELEIAHKDCALLTEELVSHKAAAEEYLIAREQTRKQSEIIVSLHQDLSEAHNEREELAKEVETLKAQLGSTRVLAELQHTLQRVKDEKDAIQEEKAKQEGIMRDLQAQLARIPTTPALTASPPNCRRRPSTLCATPSCPESSVITGPSAVNVLCWTSAVLSPSSSRDSDIDSPATSVTPSATNGHASTVVADTEFAQQLQERTKQMEEQDAIIKTLNKQLTHCEADLQAHMDLVNNLETSSETLRKIATELARERDNLNGQIESLRSELAEAKREVALVRRSVVEEKQSLEQRLDEERRAKERVRHQLDARMDELSKRKSKFVCI